MPGVCKDVVELFVLMPLYPLAAIGRCKGQPAIVTQILPRNPQKSRGIVYRDQAGGGA